MTALVNYIRYPNSPDARIRSYNLAARGYLARLNPAILALFKRGLYVRGVAPGTASGVVGHSAGSALTYDASGQLIVDRPTANLLPDPTYSGLAVGTYGTATALGGGFQRNQPFGVEVVAKTADRIRFRLYRTGGSPSTTTPVIRFSTFPGTAIPTLSRGGLVMAATLKLISLSGSATGALLFLQPATAGVTGTAKTAILSTVGVDTHLSLFTNPGAANTILAAVGGVSSSATADFEIVFEVVITAGQNPQLEDGSSLNDYSTPVVGSRTGYVQAKVPVGTYDLLAIGEGGGIWQSASGDTNLVPALGTTKIEGIYSPGSVLTKIQKDAFVDEWFPVRYSTRSEIVAEPFDGLTYAGIAWVKQNDTDVEYCLGIAKNRTNQVRFEVRPGDQWTPDGDARGRSELSMVQKYPQESEWWVSYSVKVSTEYPMDDYDIWTVIGQAHETDDANDTPHSPPFAFQLDANDLLIAVRGDTAAQTTSPPHINVLKTISNFQRGVWHDFVIRFVFSKATANGQLQIWRNGVEELNATGLLMGYNNAQGDYWKYGIYRAPGATQSVAVEYANMEVSAASLLARVTAPLPRA